MATTLIVRDATLAINGAPEKRDEPRAHLRARVAEVANMDPRTAEECVEVLSSVARGESVDPEVLEALVIIGMAHPRLAARLGLDTSSSGRRLAVLLERSGSVDRSFAVLEALQQRFPGDASLERDLAQLMRRQGMVKDLVTRYYERARRLVREGRHNEAAGWLREVLQLDPKRRDAARMLRDLRFKRVKRSGGGSILRVLFGSALLALGVSYLALREMRLREEFLTLPTHTGGNSTALKRRLADLERFVSEHPIWHGALRALSERTELRLELALVEERERQERESRERAERERLESAQLSLERGRMFVQSGDLERALASLREALIYGGPEWAEYSRVAADVAALEASLSEKP